MTERKRRLLMHVVLATAVSVLSVMLLIDIRLLGQIATDAVNPLDDVYQSRHLLETFPGTVTLLAFGTAPLILLMIADKLKLDRATFLLLMMMVICALLIVIGVMGFIALRHWHGPRVIACSPDRRQQSMALVCMNKHARGRTEGMG